MNIRDESSNSKPARANSASSDFWSGGVFAALGVRSFAPAIVRLPRICWASADF